MATTSSVLTDALIRNHESDRIIIRKISCTYIDDTADDDLSLTIGTGLDWTGQGSTGKLATKIEGWFLQAVHIKYGSTGPTDNSDLTIKIGGVDILNGEGTNAVDEAANALVYPVHKASGSPVLVPIVGAMVVAIANNAVDDATGTIDLILVAPDDVS